MPDRTDDIRRMVLALNRRGLVKLGRLRASSVKTNIGSQTVVVGRRLKYSSKRRGYVTATDRIVAVTKIIKATGEQVVSEFALTMRDNEAETVWTFSHNGKFVAGDTDALDMFEKIAGFSVRSFDEFWHRKVDYRIERAELLAGWDPTP